MGDRELLELAAKAAGYVPRSGQIHYPRLFILLKDGATDDGGWIYWNPLTCDADALRLAVKLGISVIQRCTLLTGENVAAAAGRYADDYDDSETWYDADPYAATRRVIVRAAAALKEKT